MKGLPSPGLPEQQARELLALAQGGADPKRLGAWLDGAGAPVREAVLVQARGAGVELPDEALSWPGKKLVRRALGREASAHTRRTMIARDEGFQCVHCGADVPPAGRTSRNHCPRCLRSLHVDVVPGDRAATCGGRLDPVGLVLDHGRPVILHRCVRCGETRRVRALVEGSTRDDPAALAALSAGRAP